MSLYRILGLGPAVCKEEVRAAYKRQALVAHPDKGGSKEAFHAVTHAFETLHDDAARLRYDRRLSRSVRAAGVRPRRPAGATAGPPGPAANPETCAAHSSAHPPPSGAGSSRVGSAAGPSGAEAAIPAPADGPQAGQQSGGPQEEAACASSGHVPPSEPASAGARGPGRPKKRPSLESLLERLEGFLRRLSSETRRRILETRFTQLQRRALEQWMVSRQAAETSSAAQDATSTPADSALVEVNAGPSSSFGSDVSDSSESEYARLTLRIFLLTPLRRPLTAPGCRAKRKWAWMMGTRRTRTRPLGET